MVVRITCRQRENVTTIRVEGRLDGRSVETLFAECRKAGNSLRLDVTDLRSLDREGVHALRALTAKGADLEGCSPYVRKLLIENRS